MRMTTCSMSVSFAAGAQATRSLAYARGVTAKPAPAASAVPRNARRVTAMSGQLEHRQGRVVVDPLEPYADGRPDAYVPGRRADHVRHQPRTLVEVDKRDGVGQQRCE